MGTRPHFLGIGAQRAGTTWLFHNLRRHRGIYMPEAKELHFFDRSLKAGAKLDDYESFFRAGADMIRGEITPAYSILDVKTIARVKAYVPAARIVLLVRNPIHRAWSHAVMALATKRRRRIESVGADEIYAHFQNRESLERGDYETILGNWRSIYGHEQVFVGFFEDIVEKPDLLLRQICEHIGAPLDGIEFDESIRHVYHKGSYERMPQEYEAFLHGLYRQRIERLGREQLLGERALKWVGSSAPVKTMEGGR